MAEQEEMVERLARVLFMRTKEGRDGWTWPVNGESGRKRDMDDARRVLPYILGDGQTPQGAGTWGRGH
jgi:hypothetical protein